ncbi:MAG: hypothetical protein ACI9WS_000216 [Paraglaciecola psychrophila]|jgi:uncharacterized protein (TIGR00369 family)
MIEQKPRRSDAEVLATFHRAKRRPNCSEALTMRVEAVCQQEQRVAFSFVGQEAWTNPMGGIQGGFLSAMLDEAMTTTGVVGANFQSVLPTLEFKVSFLRPGAPGQFTASGRWIRIGKSIAFLEAELFDAGGKLVARSSATASPRPIPARS